MADAHWYFGIEPCTLRRVQTSPQSGCPERLWVVRHGESAGNVARDHAELHQLPAVDVSPRDVDIPLSPRGVRQSRALGRWFGALPEAVRPTIVLSSPHLRARQTANEVTAMAYGHEVPHHVDERLREKEFGALHRLTRRGVAAHFPQEAEMRAAVGKFYYRPPGGESWCDVILRLRSLLEHVQLQYQGERVLIVAHQIIVLCMRYVLEDLDEERVLAIDNQGDVANCSVTSFVRTSDGQRERLVLDQYNFVTPLEAEGAPVTREKDDAVTQ